MQPLEVCTPFFVGTPADYFGYSCRLFQVLLLILEYDPFGEGTPFDFKETLAEVSLAQARGRLLLYTCSPNPDEKIVEFVNYLLQYVMYSLH